MNLRKKGQFGEKIALLFLKKYGLKIVSTNYFSSFGEIDIIAYDSTTEEYCFIEVKYRTSYIYGAGSEFVDEKKLSTMYEVSQHYFLEIKSQQFQSRFDSLSIHRDLHKGVFKIKYIKGLYFE